MLKVCEAEGCYQQFETRNVRRLYCCAACRRKTDNERKKDRRADAAEMREEYVMPDVWVRNDLGDDVMQNALTDGWTEECYMCADEAIAGPMACQACHHWKARASSKRKGSIDLLCWGCRNGVKV